MKYLLGLSYGHHESSACLLSERGSWSYAREEWYSRIKHDHRYPHRAICELVKDTTDNNVQIVSACLHEKPLRTWLGSGFRKGLSREHYLQKLRQFKSSNLSLHSRLRRDWGVPPERVFFSSHHLSHHLTSVMLTDHSPDYGLVLDGYGEAISGSFFKEVREDLLTEKSFPIQASLGLMYSAVTEWCGYSPAHDESKVMALSAFARPVHLDWISENVLFLESSNLTINPIFFNFEDTSLPTFTESFVDKFGPRVHRSVFFDLQSPEAKRACEVISSFQVALESVVESLVTDLVANKIRNDYEEPSSLVLSGGVFANICLVSRLVKMREQVMTLVSPSPGDGGSSIGAAYFGAKATGWKMNRRKSAFVGPRLGSLADHPHLFRPVTTEASTSGWVDNYLSEGHILPFFQGVAEIGPRSLGVRSLICRINQESWVERLNQTVKRRERFRPVAPMMLEADPAVDVLGLNTSEKLACQHMGTLVKVTPDFLRLVPEVRNVMHVDYTIRLQLLSDDDVRLANIHPSLSEALKKHRVLANTSFNISGDPTVGTPLDCYINLRRMSLGFVAADNIVFQVI